MTKRILLLALRYGLGIGLLTWVVVAHWDMTSPEGEAVGLSAAVQRPVAWWRLALAVLFSVAATGSTFVRWYLLVRAQGLPFGPTDALRLGLVGYFLNTFMPGTVGGDLVKAAFLAREQTRRTVAVATVVFDRLVGMTGLYSLALTSAGVLWALGWDEWMFPDGRSRVLFTSAVGIAAAILSVLLGGWVVLRSVPLSWSDVLLARLGGWPRVGGVLAEAWRAAWMYRHRGPAVALAYACAVVNHVLNVPAVYFAATAVAPPDAVPEFGLHFLIVPIGTTIQASFPAPGGVGAGEFAFGKLYELLGYAFAHGVLALLLLRAISWVVGFAGYLVYLQIRRATPPPDGQAAQSPPGGFAREDPRKTAGR